jgi:DNA (cytosine-5)-methyltransferase 1
MWKIGVAQTRKRMLLAASRVAGFDVNLSRIVRAAETPERPLSWACGDLLGKENPARPLDAPSTHSPTNQARIKYLFDHELHNLPDSERPDCHRLKPHTYPAVYGRMWWDRPAPTITGGFACCGRGRFVHPLRERTLTPHEAARVQFFPDFFDFGDYCPTQLQRVIGNAVPAKAGYVLALPLLLAALEAEGIEGTVAPKETNVAPPQER